MRYGIWILAMISDLIVLGVLLLLLTGDKPSLLTLGIAGALVYRWWRIGGLDAWRPSVVRAYHRNAKELGLR